jgi:hypothetical protein
MTDGARVLTAGIAAGLAVAVPDVAAPDVLVLVLVVLAVLGLTGGELAVGDEPCGSCPLGELPLKFSKLAMMCFLEFMIVLMRRSANCERNG